MTKKLFILTAIISIFAFSFASAQTVIYTDDFNTDTSANFTENNGTDVQIDYAWDYSAATDENAAAIPAAPNTGDSSKTGLRMQVNIAGSGGTNTNIFTKQTFENDYEVQVDLFWRIGDGTSGTTEYYRVGINHDGTNLLNFIQADTANAPLATDGYFFGGTGEAGSTLDYYFMEGSAVADTEGGTFEGSGEIAKGHGNGYLPWDDGAGGGIYGDTVKYIYTGCCGNQWTTIKILYQRDIVSVYLDDTLAAKYTDTDKTYTSGKICLGMEDMYSSMATNSYIIYDNLKVTQIPVPLAANASWQLYE
jgi:hypothetical protein